jgi:hypothetical protein
LIHSGATSTHDAKGLAWLVGPMTVITLAGYIALYAATSGRFCTARLNHREQTGVIIWAWVAALTFVVLATSALLRARARRLGGSPGGGGVRKKL